MSRLSNDLRAGETRFAPLPALSSCAFSVRLSSEFCRFAAFSFDKWASVAKISSHPRMKENQPVPTQKITPFLWFDHQAEEAARFYTSIFPNSKIGKVVRCGEAGPGPVGSVLTVEFQLEGQ